MTDTQAVREGFRSITPYLIVRDGQRAIDFYRAAFGAEELSRHADADGRVRHAELRIGDSTIMLGGEALDEWPEWQSPETRGGTPVHIYMYVPDADASFARAIAAGASELLPMKDQEYGERSGGVTDPFGHVWYVATPLPARAGGQAEPGAP